MDAEQDANRKGNLSIVVAAMSLLLIGYVGSSGPAQFIDTSEAGMRLKTMPAPDSLDIPFQQGSFGASRWMGSLEKIYSPLVWIDDTLPTGGLLTKYWNLFPAPRHFRSNVDRREYSSDVSMARREAVSADEPDDEDADGLDEWLVSPKARTGVNFDLGVD